MRFIKEKLNKDYFEISLYVIFTCIVIYLLSKVADNMPGIIDSTKSVFSWIALVLEPVIIGFVIAYLFFPLLGRIESLLRKISIFKKKKSVRGISVAILSLSVCFLIFFVVSMIISVVTNQFRTANADDLMKMLTTYANSIQNFYNELMEGIENLNINSDGIKGAIESVIKNIGNYILGLSSSVGNLVNNVKDILITCLFAIIFSIYFLLDSTRLYNYWGRIVKIVLPDRVYKYTKIAMEDADKVFSGYIRGQVLDAIIVGVVSSIALTIAGLQYSLVIGLLVGISNLVPYLGPVIGYTTTALVGIATGEIKIMIVSLIILLIIQTIDGNLLSPKLLSNSINIHPMLVIIAITVGAKLGGIMGMVVAVPISAIIKIWLERLIDLREKRKERKINR